MKKFDEINIIPFIDIMLVLLAIVLITASFISQGKIQVNVPKASASVAFKSSELAKLITVTANGELFFNDKPTNLESLETEIAGWDKAQKVTLKIDADATFQDFVSVTDLLAKNDIKDVAIVATKDKGSEKPKITDPQAQISVEPQVAKPTEKSADVGK